MPLPSWVRLPMSTLSSLIVGQKAEKCPRFAPHLFCGEADVSCILAVYFTNSSEICMWEKTQLELFRRSQ